MAECAWCSDPVEDPGDTCGFDCYAVWCKWHSVEESHTVILLGTEIVPKTLTKQPWYLKHIREGE